MCHVWCQYEEKKNTAEKWPHFLFDEFWFQSYKEKTPFLGKGAFLKNKMQNN